VIYKLYFYNFYRENKNNLRDKRLMNIRHEKYGRKSQYSMFSLIDENDEETTIGYFALISEIFSNRVINIFIKDRFIYLLFYQFVVYCL
jgi:hypothetical protein